MTIRTFGLRLPLGPGGIPASAWGQASAPISRPTLCEQWWLLNVNVSSARSWCAVAGTRRRGRLARGAPRPARGARRGRHLTREPCPRLGLALRASLPRYARSSAATLLIMSSEWCAGPRSHRTARRHCGTPVWPRPGRLTHRALPATCATLPPNFYPAPSARSAARIFIAVDGRLALTNITMIMWERSIYILDMCSCATAGRGASSATVPYVMRIRDAYGGSSPGAASHDPDGEPRGGRKVRANECIAVARRQSTGAGARACSRRAPRSRPRLPPRFPVARVSTPAANRRSGRRGPRLPRARLAAPLHARTAAPPHRRTQPPTHHFLAKHSLSLPLLV